MPLGGGPQTQEPRNAVCVYKKSPRLQWVCPEWDSQKRQVAKVRGTLGLARSKGTQELPWWKMEGVALTGRRGPAAFRVCSKRQGG